jgi:protein tyrosine/serine phosphatase
MKQPRGSLLRILLAVSALALLVGGYLVYRHKTSPYHFRVVEPGVLYRSGWLTPGNLDMILRERGIKTVFNVSEEREKCKPDWWHVDEIRLCRKHGVRLIEVPIPSGVPPDRFQLGRWLELIADESAWPILVHCDHGVMRTGMLVAVFEMERHAKSPRQAFSDMPMFGHTMEGERKKPMRRFVLDYVPGRDRGAREGPDGVPPR